MQRGSPILFQPRLRSTCQRQGSQEDSSHQPLSPASPRALSGHGYEDRSQGDLHCAFPCSERDGDSLAPGNQASGAGEPRHLGGVGRGRPDVGHMLRGTVRPHQHVSGC